MNDGIIRTCLDEREMAINSGLQPASWLLTASNIKRLSFDNHPMFVVLGEKSCGKTIFSNLLQSILGPEIKVFSVAVGPLFNRAFFLDQLKVLFGLEGTCSLAHLIAKTNEAQQHQLLIIDDAHFLSAVFIEEILGELQQLSGNNYFHVCLVSDFLLAPILNRLEKDSYKGMVDTFELGALSEGETKSYVLQNLSPGQSVEKIVTDDLVRQFYQLTAGHLANINLQMHYFFKNNARTSLRNDNFLRRMTIAAGALCVGIGVNYVWHSQDFQSVLIAFLNQAPPSAAIANAIPLPQIEPVYQSEIPSYQLASTQQVLLPTPLRRADLVAMDEEDSGVDGSLVVMDKVVVAPKVIQPKTKSTTDHEVTSPLSGAHPSVLGNRFTIQLLASHSKNELFRFAALHHLNGKTKVRTARREGVLWYILTLGEYSERESAKNVVNHLPKDIEQFKPWVRTIADLNAAG